MMYQYITAHTVAVKVLSIIPDQVSLSAVLNKSGLCPTTVLKNTVIDRTLNINVRVGLSPVDNSFAHKNNSKKHPMFARTKV